MKNILLALDLHGNDEKIIAHARELAKKFKSKIWLVHIAAPDPDFIGYEVGPQYIRDSRAEELRQEHRQLHFITESIQNDGIEADALLIQGPTVEMLKNEVTKLNIDLVIIGSHKHGFIYETFVGHTGNKLVKQLSIPVLLIPLDNE